MKRVGELYEVVVFTASVSKVIIDCSQINWIASRLTHASTVIRCLTNWISTRSSIIDYSVKVATTIKATTSRFVSIGLFISFDRLLILLSRISLKSAVTYARPSSLTIHPHPTSSIHSMPYPSVAGSPTHTTTSCWISYPSSKIWPEAKSET